MSRGVALSEGLLVTLARPTTWPLALAAFLVRGGLVLVVLPIVVLPTPVGIGDVVGPTLTAIALGGFPSEAVMGGAVALVCLLAWLVGGGWLAAALEAESARIVASDEDVAASAAGYGFWIFELGPPRRARIGVRCHVSKEVSRDAVAERGGGWKQEAGNYVAKNERRDIIRSAGRVIARTRPPISVPPQRIPPIRIWRPIRTRPLSLAGALAGE